MPEKTRLFTREKSIASAVQCSISVRNFNSCCKDKQQLNRKEVCGEGEGGCNCLVLT